MGGWREGDNDRGRAGGKMNGWNTYGWRRIRYKWMWEWMEGRMDGGGGMGMSECVEHGWRGIKAGKDGWWRTDRRKTGIGWMDGQRTMEDDCCFPALRKPGRCRGTCGGSWGTARAGGLPWSSGWNSSALRPRAAGRHRMRLCVRLPACVLTLSSCAGTAVHLSIHLCVTRTHLHAFVHPHVCLSVCSEQGRMEQALVAEQARAGALQRSEAELQLRVRELEEQRDEANRAAEAARQQLKHRWGPPAAAE